jgi:hypothetical protein
MRRIKLIKRKREVIIEILQETLDHGKIKSNSIVMVNRKIDEFEDKVRKELESNMIIFSSDVHSQRFLLSLVPSFRDGKRKLKWCGEKLEWCSTCRKWRECE